MCIGQVMEVYFEAYNSHCYTDEPITKLDDISYISLHVYFLIHLDLFSNLIKENCNLLTHHNPSNIVYHIRASGISIDGNILRLVGNEKKYYFEYFGREEIIEKMIGKS